MNRFSKWSSGLTEETYHNGHAEDDACTRIKKYCYAKVFFKPKFKFSKDSSIFTIGSCFAREIEEVLLANKLRVASREFTLPKEVKFDDIAAKSSFHLPNNNEARIFTKFNPYSILDELKVALTDEPWDSRSLVEMRGGEYWAPQVHRLPLLTKELAKEVQKEIFETTKKIKSAQLVVITLGLTEYWKDSVTGYACNGAPVQSAELIKSKRFEFHNCKFEETKKCLNDILGLLIQANPNIKVVVSVSPIPLQRTFTGQDVIVANAYSKSMLRTIANEIASNHDFVDYFPSYEIIMNSGREKAWLHDERHVSRGIVEYVTKQFISNYFL